MVVRASQHGPPRGALVLSGPSESPSDGHAHARIMPRSAGAAGERHPLSLPRHRGTLGGRDALHGPICRCRSRWYELGGTLQRGMELKRRKPFERWTPADVAGDVETAFFGDFSQRYVRAAVVLRYAPERLPKADAEAWLAEATADYGENGIPTYGVFAFDFNDADRAALYMDHDPTVLIRDIEVKFDLSEAVAAARQWTGDKTTEAEFQNIPGVYQTALIEAITGTSRLWEGSLSSSWHFPSDGRHVVCRKYPPPVGDEPIEFVLVPRGMGEMAYWRHLRSPMVASQMRRVR